MTDIQEFMESKFNQPIGDKQMTYAEKLAKLWAKEVGEYLTGKTQYSETIMAASFAKAIEQAMQAQREADAKALEDACFILKNFDTLTAKPQLQQAILNAEVQP